MNSLKELILTKLAGPLFKEADDLEDVEIPQVVLGFQVLKDKKGRYSKWIGVYSNSFRDDDAVPEILTSEGHKGFEKRVDAGSAPLPELWLWHNPLWKFGEATFVTVDEVEPGVVFAIAGGDIDPDKEFLAKAMDESGADWRMSHTFYPTRIGDEDSYLDWYVEEVSPLLAGYEANPLTGFGLVKEMIDKGKREQIKDALGVNDDFLDRLESLNAGVADMAKQENRTFKEKDAPEVTAEAPEVTGEEKDVTVDTDAVDETVETVAEVEETTEEVVEETTEEVVAAQEPVEDTPVVPDPVHILNQSSVIDALTTTIKSMATIQESQAQELRLIREGMSVIQALQQDVATLKEAAQVQHEKESMTPFASRLNYSSIIAPAVAAQKAQRARMNTAEIEDDDPLSKAAPEEAKQEDGEFQYGSFINDLVQKSRA